MLLIVDEITTSRFTPPARRFILTEPSLDGRDFDGVIEWLRDYATKWCIT